MANGGIIGPINVISKGGNKITSKHLQEILLHNQELDLQKF